MFFFKLGSSLKNFLFNAKILKPKKVKTPVISVGNIIAGGSGKTTFIKKLCSDLKAFQTISIISRGYRSKISNKVVSPSVGAVFKLQF